MQLDFTYRQIWKISAPIMLGSAAQNVITLSDAVLLYHRGEAEFAAIGFAGVFYITVAAIGYGFSRGGQILIARRMGENHPEAVGPTFHAMLYFELLMASLMWAVMRFGAPYIFSFFLENSPEAFRKSLEYTHFRSYGIFFSYAGISLISLYTGIARPKIILWDTLVLALVNLLLNYALIFGVWGFPEMGIGGSGLASSIAEGVAFVVFVAYMIFDKQNRPLHIFNFSKPDWKPIRQQLQLALPIVAHSALGQSSWIFFFGIIANLGTRALAISNLARTVYLLLSIPLWGFSAGANTLISNLMGQDRGRDVPRAALKIGWLCWLVTMAIALPTLLFPDQILYPLLGDADANLIGETKPLFHLMFAVLTFATFGSVVVNSLAGTGATRFSLLLQAISVAAYLMYVWTLVKVLHVSLVWAWTGEIFYWLLMISFVVWYLKKGGWREVRI